MIDNHAPRQMIRRLMNEMSIESVFIARNRWLWLSPVAAAFYCPINH